jgi:hypothetical protein
MRVRLLPAVYGHIADSVRDGPAVRRTACPPGCAGLAEDCWRVCKPSGRSLMASSWPTHRQDPSAAQRVAADPGSGGGLAKGCCRSAVRLSVRAWRPAPRCSAPRPARGASGCSRAGSLSAWTLDGPAVDLRWTWHVPGDLHRAGGGQILVSPAHSCRVSDAGGLLGAPVPGRDQTTAAQRVDIA